ncbi:MAG TPA: ATP-binding protein [Allosphingosinicella sp.]|nr:ATP-binding protein [Allosphingosinicella sp.]
MTLSTCSDEPIHAPGSIQAHGALVVLEPGSDRIIAAAGDMEALLGFPGDPVGHSFESLVGLPLSARTGGAGLEPGHEPLFLGAMSAGTASQELDILAHQRDGRIIVELEPSLQNRPSGARLLARLRAGVVKIKDMNTVEAACLEAAEAIRSFSGFERVLGLRFLEDGSGKVIAEVGGDTLGPLLNQHFPASDIPEQARALYLRNLIRAIPDVNYIAAPLRSEGNLELDMSDCALRSISPVHIQYLKNMGVAASMSVSIVRGQELWGMIVCHGRHPVPVPYEMREACKHLAAALSQQIESIMLKHRARESRQLAIRREDTLAQLAAADAVEVEIKRRLPEILGLIPARGVVICHRGAIATYGLTPSESESAALCAWARRQDGALPYSTATLSQAFAPAREYEDLASGLLAIAAGAADPIEIMWLRPEYPETVEWAGNPHDEATGGPPSEALTPRRSFAIWLESVRGRAEPWTVSEIDAAQRLRDGIERIRGRQRLNSLQAEVIHMSRVNAMGTMASAIAHELNQPLTIIRNYAAGLTHMLEKRSNPDPEISDILNRVSDQALRAGEIIRHLREMVAGGESSMSPTVVREVVETACSIALLDAPRVGVTSELSVPSDLKVLADSVQVQQVIMNLVGNALDAVEGLEAGMPRKLTITACRLPPRCVQLTVWDSGNGLTEGVRDKLFSAFNGSKQDGLGIGLSICRTIVEAHGGRIWVEEPESGGTAFSFTLQEAPDHD